MVFVLRFFKNSSTNSLMRSFLNSYGSKFFENLQKSREFKWYTSHLSYVNQSYQNFFEQLLENNNTSVLFKNSNCVEFNTIFINSNLMYCFKKALFKVSDKIRIKKKRRVRKKPKNAPLTNNSHSSLNVFKIDPLILNVNSSNVHLTYLNCPKKSTKNMACSYRDVLINSSVHYVEETKSLKDEYKKIRYEIDTPYGKWIKGGWLDNRAKKGTTFKVLSYNILAQYLLRLHSDLYVNHDKKYLSWEYRSQALIEEFSQYDSDIICLQEVEASKLKFFNENLYRLGYIGVFKKRTHEKEDGCAIYYKENKFNLKELVTVEYYQPGIQLLNRDNIGIIVRLCPNDNPRKNLIVANTHLLFNPKRQDVKLAQMQVMLAEIDRVAYKNNNANKIKYHPIILTGDFNLKPFSYVYNLLVNGSMNIENLRTIPSNLGISSNCQHFDLSNMRTGRRLNVSDAHYTKLYNSERNNQHSGGETPPWRIRNNYDYYGPYSLCHGLNLDSVYPHNDRSKTDATTFQNAWCNVDYIFYGPKRIIDGRKEDDELKLISYLKLPFVHEAPILKNIPNEVCASDHLPLLATFHLPTDVSRNGYKS